MLLPPLLPTLSLLDLSLLLLLLSLPLLQYAAAANAYGMSRVGR